MTATTNPAFAPPGSSIPEYASLGRAARIATFGDSKAFVDGLGQNAESPVAFPTSGGIAVGGPVEKYPLVQYVRARLVSACGIPGQTTQEALNRSAAAASATRKSIHDCLATGPDVVLLHCGSINDVNQLQGPISQEVVDGVVDRHCRIARQLLEAGVAVIDPGNAGYLKADDPNEPYICDALARINAGIYSRMSGVSRWRFANPEGRLSIGGKYFAGMSTDGTHLSALGGAVLGEIEAEQFRTLFLPYSGPDKKRNLYDSLYAWANPANNRPAGWGGLTPTNGTRHSEATTSEYYEARVTIVSDGATVNCNGLAAIMGTAKQGDIVDFAITMGVFRTDGTPVRNAVMTVSVYLYDATNAKSIRYPLKQWVTGADGIARMLHPIPLPADVSALGSSSYLFAGINAVEPGEYLFRLYPMQIWAP